MSNLPNREIVNHIHEQVAGHGGIVTDVLGMVRYIDSDGQKRQMILLDGGSADSEIDVIAGAGMAAAIGAFVDGWVQHQFRRDPSA